MFLLGANRQNAIVTREIKRVRVSLSVTLTTDLSFTKKYDCIVVFVSPELPSSLSPPHFQHKTRDHYKQKDIDKSGRRQLSVNLSQVPDEQIEKAPRDLGFEVRLKKSHGILNIAKKPRQ